MGLVELTISLKLGTLCFGGKVIFLDGLVVLADHLVIPFLGLAAHCIGLDHALAVSTVQLDLP